MHFYYLAPRWKPSSMVIHLERRPMVQTTILYKHNIIINFRGRAGT